LALWNFHYAEVTASEGAFNEAAFPERCFSEIAILKLTTFELYVAYFLIDSRMIAEYL
jgi:hypothetical protein